MHCYELIYAVCYLLLYNEEVIFLSHVIYLLSSFNDDVLDSYFHWILLEIECLRRTDGNKHPQMCLCIGYSLMGEIFHVVQIPLLC